MQIFVYFESQIDPADSTGRFLFSNTSDESNHAFRICLLSFLFYFGSNRVEKAELAESKSKLCLRFNIT